MRLTPTSALIEGPPALNGDGSKLAFLQASPSQYNAIVGLVTLVDLRDPCAESVFEEVARTNSSFTGNEAFADCFDARFAWSVEPEKLAWWDRVGGADYKVHVPGASSGFYSTQIIATGGNNWNTPRPHLSADGSTIWFYSRATSGRGYSSIATVGNAACELDDVLPGATSRGLSDTGDKMAAVFSTDTALQVRRYSRTGSVWCASAPTFSTLAVGNPMLVPELTDLWAPNEGISDVSMSGLGKHVAWTSAIDHCSSSTPKPALTTRDIWVHFDDVGDIPPWMATCASNANLARAEMDLFADGDDERAVLAPDGSSILFISDGDYADPFSSLERPMLFLLDLDPGIADAESAIVRVSDTPASGHRVFWGALSGDGQVAGWQQGSMDPAAGLTAGDVYLANLYHPEASRTGDVTTLLPDHPLHVEIADCLSARGVVTVSVLLRQWVGGERRLILLGSVSNSTSSEAFGPLVQRISDGQLATVDVEVPDLTGSLTCTVRVLDPSQSQPDLADAELIP